MRRKATKSYVFQVALCRIAQFQSTRLQLLHILLLPIIVQVTHFTRGGCSNIPNMRTASLATCVAVFLGPLSRVHLHRLDGHVIEAAHPDYMES